MKFILVALLLLGGCAYQKLAVKQLDNILEIETASRLDLYRSQKKVLEADISVFLRTQKPHIERLKALINELDPAKVEAIDGWWQKLISEYQRIATEYSAILAKHLVTLDSKQRQAFFERMKRDNEDIRKKMGEQSVERLTDRAEYFFGDLNSAQIKALEAHLPQVKARSEARLQRREDLYNKLLTLLNSEALGPEIERKTLEAFSDFQSQTLSQNASAGALIKELSLASTPEQHAHFRNKRKELSELIDIFVTTDF
jgi:predicted nuclease with TOPRIM domain